METSNNQKWAIFSDYQASIRAIAQQNPKHLLVKTIQTIIQLQTQNKEICFCKVSSQKSPTISRLPYNLDTP